MADNTPSSKLKRPRGNEIEEGRELEFPNPKRPRHKALPFARRISSEQIKFETRLGRENQNDRTKELVLAAKAPYRTSAGPDPDVDPPVAVKKFRCGRKSENRGLYEAFVAEVELLVDLSHPNVGGLIGFVEEPEKDIAWIVSGWESSGNITEFLATGDPGTKTRVGLVMDTLAGLTYLHTREPPICHGNLKSHNVLVSSSSRAIITDLGSAHAVHKVRIPHGYRTPTDSEEGPATPSMYSAYTPIKISRRGSQSSLVSSRKLLQWIPPEVDLGLRKQMSLPGDIWALGWICCEVVTNNLPFPYVQCPAHRYQAPQVISWESPVASGDEEIAAIDSIYSFMEMCWSINPNTRPTSKECEIELKKMHSFVSSPELLQLKNPEIRSIPLLCALACRQYLQGSQESATTLFHKALAAVREPNDLQTIVDALKSINDAYCPLRNYSAMGSFWESHKDCVCHSHDQHLANVARVLGSVYALESRFNDAEASFLFARDICRRISDTVGEARTSANLGLLYNAQARCDEALECFKFAYNTFSSWDMEHEIADTFMGLGELFRLRGMHNNAERIFKKALELYIGMDDDAGKTAALCEIDNGTLVHDTFSSRDTVTSDDIWEFSSEEGWDATSPRNDSEGGSERPGDSATIKELVAPVDRDTESDLEALVAPISSMPFSVNGHFGDVFEGTHRTLGKVALKRPRVSGKGYDDDVIRRFEREAATWRRLRHRHILEFIGTMKRDGHVYIISPFIDNGTLMEYVAREPKVNKVRLLCETADAVNYLHTEAVVHGDIKAGNILISKEGFALLCDFGLTRMMDARTSTCMKGAGSVRWMSPELWDTAPRSFESDVYAFGMTIAEVLSGKEPFPHLSNTMAVMKAVMMENERPLREPTSSLDGLPYGGAWDVAEACWPANPSDRISMAQAFERLCSAGGANPHGPILFCEQPVRL